MDVVDGVVWVRARDVALFRVDRVKAVVGICDGARWSWFILGLSIQ